MLSRLVIILLCGIVAHSVAQVSIGGNFSTSLVQDRNINDQIGREVTTTEWEFKLVPSVIIVPGSGKLEIVPSAGIGVTVGSEEIKNPPPAPVEESDWTNVGFGGGLGVFVRAVEGTVLRLSLGPEGFFWVDMPEGDDNNDVTVGAAVPINLDFLLTQKVFIRASARVITVSYYRDNINDRHYTSQVRFFDISSLWAPVLGFYVNF